MTTARRQPETSRPPPPRARNGDRPSPHERILLVARDLFCRHGIHATGIDRILSAAGASKMTLYSRFGSKEALLREVLAQEGEFQRDTIFGAVGEAGPDPRDGLLAVTEGLRRLFRGDDFFGCAFMNAAAEHTKGKEAETWLRQVAKEHGDEILRRLQLLAIEAGFDDPALLARQIHLVMDGAVAAMMISGDRSVLDVADRNIQAVLASHTRGGAAPGRA